MDNILTSIKKLLGLEASYDHFDEELIAHINSVFFTLSQLGVGPEEGFSITDDSATWDDFMEVSSTLEAVKMYIYQKVRLSFDPPSVAFVLDAIQRQITELEFRIMTKVEVPVLEVVVEEEEYGL